MRIVPESRQLGMFEKLVIDSFAGGGGASTGIEAAIGRPVDIAINHDPEAIAMHTANHPLTKHYLESIWDVDPLEATQGRPVGLLWLSPDCKHFSKAKGGKPVDQNIRGLAEVSVRWAELVKPDCMILENVVEFLTYGPLLPDNTPDPERKGEYFEDLMDKWRAQGYDQIEWREIMACDFGTPTIRKRIFIIARRDGKPIVWPEPTHGKPGSPGVLSGKLKPWRTAAECIDWDLPIPSIFERKKPLADATLRRIARGIQKYVFEAKEPFIVTCNHQGPGFRGQGLGEPMKTVTAARDAHGIVMPALMHYRDHPSGKPRINNPKEPVSTITAGGIQQAVLAPTLIQTGYGERKGQAPRVPGLDKPLGTAMAQGVKHAVAVASLLKHYGGNYQGKGSDPKEPLGTVTCKDHNSVMAVTMLRQFGTTTGHKPDEPMKTVMAGGAGGKNALCAVTLKRDFGKSVGQSVKDPAPTVTANGGGHSSLVYSFLQQYNKASIGQDLKRPCNAVTTRDRLALVTIESVEYVIADIGMRMLEPLELYRAQGFPDGYIIDPIYNGKPLSKTAQVKMCGNSVCPPVAEVLVRANWY